MSRINHFKTQISLIDFIMNRPSLGFIVSDKSKKNEILLYREVKTDKGEPIKTDTLIVSRFTNGTDSYDYYFNTNEDWKNNSKSVVDFIHEFILHNGPNERIDYSKVFGILDEYIKSDNYISPNDSSWEMIYHKKRGEGSTIENLRDLVKLPTQVTFDYLKSRHINPETYLNPIFLSTYGTYNYTVDKDDQSYSYSRPAFLFLNNQNKLQTIQQIVETNTGRDKYFLKDVDKGSSLFKSQINKDTNLIVVTEAPEKAMAHFQLSEEQFKAKKLNPYYLATAGNVGNLQLEHLSSIINERKLDTLITYDNDKSGDLYTLKTISSIIHPDNVSWSITTINAELYIGVEINNINSILTDIKSNQAQTLINDSRNGIIGIVGSIDYKSRHAKGAIDYIPYTPENVSKLINSLTTNIKEHLNIQVKTHKSITKDWVDDLERKASLKRDVHIHPRLPEFNENKAKLQNNL